jgi:hypothetical protein
VAAPTHQADKPSGSFLGRLSILDCKDGSLNLVGLAAHSHSSSSTIDRLAMFEHFPLRHQTLA